MVSGVECAERNQRAYLVITEGLDDLRDVEQNGILSGRGKRYMRGGITPGLEAMYTMACVCVLTLGMEPCLGHSLCQ